LKTHERDSMFKDFMKIEAKYFSQKCIGLWVVVVVVVKLL
jgi:hypothetical protein